MVLIFCAYSQFPAFAKQQQQQPHGLLQPSAPQPSVGLGLGALILLVRDSEVVVLIDGLPNAIKRWVQKTCPGPTPPALGRGRPYTFQMGFREQYEKENSPLGRTAGTHCA